MLPFLDLSSKDYSTRSAETRRAREASWCAKTPYGLAVLRHRECGQLLRDRRLRQGSFNWPRRHGMTGSFVSFWEASVIAARHDTHKALRDIIVPVLSDSFVASFVPRFEAISADLCAQLRSKDTCEFMEAFAIPFAGQAIAVLLGLERRDGVRISHDASDLGLAMGVSCKSHEARINAACDRLTDLAGELVRDARRNSGGTGLIPQMVERFDQSSGLSETDLLNLIVITIFGGVDTTRSQLGLGMALFIENPAQWAAVRVDLTLVPNAVEEMIRQRPTTTWVTREAIESFEFHGTEIEKGTMIHLLVHASATDPLVGEAASFDVSAKRKSHFGFGGGAHHCIGHLIARTDMAVALRSLCQTLETVSYAGEPIFLPDSGNTSPVSLPISYRLT